MLHQILVELECNQAEKTFSLRCIYSSPPLMRASLLSNNSVLIRDVSFGGREDKGIHSTCCQIILSLLEMCPLVGVSFKRGTTVHVG